MQIKSEADIAFSLSRYFQTCEDYYILHFEFMKDNEYWLVNPQAVRFHFIRITYVNDTEINDLVLANINQSLYDEFGNTIKTKGPLLNLCVGYPIGKLAVNGVVNYKIDSTIESVSLLASFFPGLLKYYAKNKNDEFIHETGDEIYNKSMKNKAKTLTPYITYTLIGICIVMFLMQVSLALIYNGFSLETITSVLIDGDINSSIFLGAYYRPFVFVNNEYWRFLTAGFTHFGLVHLLCNMYSTLMLGQVLEKIYGHARYLAIFIVSIIVGSAFAHLEPGGMLVAGLSGGIFGILGSYIVFVVQNKLYKDQRIASNLGFMIIFNVLISLSGGISWAGHLGGIIAGLFISVVLYPTNSLSINKSIKLNTAIAGVILLAFISYRTINNNFLSEIYPGTDIKVVEMYHDFNIPVEKLEAGLLDLYNSGEY